MNDLLFIFLVALLVVFESFFVIVFLIESKAQKQKEALIFKVLSSACFVLIGIVGCIEGVVTLGKGLLFTVCLAFGLIGDLELALRYVHPKQKTSWFVRGTIIFALEHALLVFWLLYSNFKGWYVGVIYFAVIMTCAFLFSRAKKVDAGKLMVPGAFYIGLVIFMAGLALSNCIFNFSAGTLLLAIGGTFFAVSDVIIVIYNFGNDKRFSLSIVLHILYFLAQTLIGLSLAFN